MSKTNNCKYPLPRLLFVSLFSGLATQKPKTAPKAVPENKDKKETKPVVAEKKDAKVSKPVDVTPKLQRPARNELEVKVKLLIDSIATFNEQIKGHREEINKINDTTKSSKVRLEMKIVHVLYLTLYLFVG